MWVRAMLENVYTLPSSKQHPTTADRDGQMALGERGLDMSRHVVGTLGRMAVKARFFRNQAMKEGLEVVQNVRVGILLYQQ